MEPIADSNLIEFPRAIQRAAPMERLAEPVEELTPRIFEAEEPAVHEEEAGDSTAAQEFFDTIDDDEEAMHDDLNTSVAIAPLLPSFTLDPIPALGENDMPVQVELPLQVAPLGLRGVVALLDLAVALLATGLFSFIVKQFGALPSDPKILFAAEAFAITFFWFLYQLLYLSYAGRTLGMAVTGTRLCCFDAKYVTRLRRQMRAFSMLLSALSAGLGFAWAFFDEDALCWHDRITRTAVR
jgi:uncharacterized RDD family membrane protein YckC